MRMSQETNNFLSMPYGVEMIIMFFIWSTGSMEYSTKKLSKMSFKRPWGVGG